MTVYLHGDLTEVSIGGHNHRCDDVLSVLDPNDISLEPATVAARLADGNGAWAVSCTPACEAQILASVQFSGVSPTAIPLTQDEKARADAAAVRDNVEVAQLARALHQVAREQQRAND